MADEKRAKTVDEAAYNHLLVFTQPVEAWPPELKARLPPFSALYLEPSGPGGRAGPVTEMIARLRKIPGPVKLLLTGQKGSGKSWTLQHMSEVLADTFTVVRVSATDHSGTTLADADVSDVMVLLCEALSQRITTWQSLAEAELALHRWAEQFKGMRGLPTVPDTTEGSDVQINAFFARFASRMRSDLETRQLVRSVSADDLILVANALLGVLGAKKPALVLFDDLDKIDPVWARKLFGPQFGALARINAKMVLTFPFSVNFENVVAQQKEVLKNVQVRTSRTDPTLRAEAVERFTALLGRLVDLDLVDGLAVEEAVSYSGGITREFGRIMARAFEIAALADDTRVGFDHVQDAVRDLRVELERATSDAARRASLSAVRRGLRLDSDMDRALLNENMVVEYVNGHPWYDVHPLLADVVDAWAKPTA
jgi:hypothetical protein